jgi:hypothetical protein
MDAAFEVSSMALKYDLMAGYSLPNKPYREFRRLG